MTVARLVGFGAFSYQRNHVEMSPYGRGVGGQLSVLIVVRRSHRNGELNVIQENQDLSK